MSKLLFNGEKYCNEETGEIYTQQDLDRFSDEELFNQLRKYNERQLDYGTNVNYELRRKSDKESHKIRVKENYNFNMMHTTDLRDMILSGEFDKKEGTFIGLVTPFICYPNNDVQVKKKYLPLIELGKLIGYGKNTIGEIVKSLEEKEVIKVIWGGNKPPIIYFNPFLYSAGRDIDKEVAEMFIESKYNPNRDMDT